MGKLFTVILANGTERTVASFSNDRARLFFDISSMLELYTQLPSGISPDNGEDEYNIDVNPFMSFFHQVWRIGWIADEGGFLREWAAYAAGIIENITLEKHEWIDRNGVKLKVRRYLRDEEYG